MHFGLIGGGGPATEEPVSSCREPGTAVFIALALIVCVVTRTRTRRVLPACVDPATRAVA
jgi:hypothetical protein